MPTHTPTRTPPVTSRSVALELLNRWETSRTYADQLLHEALSATTLSDPRDRALATDLFYGVLRNLRLLDYLLEPRLNRELDLPVRNTLRLGLYQLLFTRVPEHAAVDGSVELAGYARGLVNAVLRGLLRDWPRVRRAMEDAPPAVRESYPDFLVQRWRKFLGPQELTAFLQWNNEAPENYVRLNTLKARSFDELPTGDARCLVEEAGAKPRHPLYRKVAPMPLEWLREGLVYAQDPSTAVSCELLAPQPGESVLDACAAPGGKSAYLAALMREGELVSTDANEERLQVLRGNLATQGVTFARVELGRWGQADYVPARPLQGGSETFDAVLADVPCSNTGVLRRRVDARWRLTPGEFAAMAETQLGILLQLAQVVRPGGGRLVYSTCAIDPQENEQLVRAFLQTRQGAAFRLAETRATLPWRDGVDGAFAALLIKS